MDTKHLRTLIYGLLFAGWGVVVVWQMSEHSRVEEGGRTYLRRNSKAIANTLSAFLSGLQFRGAIFKTRLQPVLDELVNSHTNELMQSSEVISVALLNVAGATVASAGRPIEETLEQKDLQQEGEHWGVHTMTRVCSVKGAPRNQESNTNLLVPLILETPTNELRGGARGFARHEGTNEVAGRPREAEVRPRRPFWARDLDDKQYQALIEERELHGLALTLSADGVHRVNRYDLWLRAVLCFFAGISAIGAGLAWRTVSQNSELQIRLVRASELNSHLKQMNLAAAGLAHETRNPLNIIRGMAQLISKEGSTPPTVREKSIAIVEETDKVTAQLNEFINYSRPREVRRIRLSLTPALQEVARALSYDLEEKKIRLEVKGEPLIIEADEQLFRQALFNLVLNATQAVGEGGQIQIVARRWEDGVAVEVRDNGPGIPADRRQEIFKPYFTTHQKGTGLGLAIVQQIVLAHGWEIECLENPPQGAVFRLTHLKLAAV